MNLHDEKVLRAQLTFVYRVMVASKILLSEAEEELGILGNDQFDELRCFFKKHYQEEESHAEWLLEDLGGSVSDDIDFTAACVAGTQYYLIKHVHPALLLGYMQALENPAPLALIEELEAVHGKQLLRTWRHHAEVDKDHLKEIEAIIALMPDDLKQKIEQNRIATLTLWNSTLKRYDHA